MIAAALLAALLAGHPAAPPAQRTAARVLRPSEPSPLDLEVLLAGLSALPDLRERVVAASALFLGVPYQFDPLGEGPGTPPDEDPRLRFDLADCQTFLETVLALSLAQDAGQLLPLLDDVRYQGEPAYAHRNHFFEAQWVLANARKGYVRDVTLAVGGKDAVQHVKVVTREQWDERTVGEKIALPDDRIPVGRFPLGYVPLGRIVEHAADIPSGTLFAVVRADRPRVPTMVTHVGLVVQKSEGAFVRHAGREIFPGVADEPLAQFVERNLGYQKWPVLGLWFLEPVRP